MKNNKQVSGTISNYNLDSSYELSKKEKATPYYQSYWAAWLQRPFYEDPVEVVKVYPKPRRTLFVVLILILTIAILALSVISFLNMVPQLALFEQISEETEAIDEDVAANISIGADDIVYSTLKSFSLEIGEDMDLVFYWSALRDIDSLETPVKIAYYAIPVSFALTVILAIYVLIKAIIALFNPSRKKFSYILLVMMLFSLLGVVGGFIWNYQPISEIQGFLLRTGTNMVLGYGYMALIGIELVAVIASLFAYRRKKTTGGK